MRITPNKIYSGLIEEKKENVGSISISGVDSDGKAIVEKKVEVNLTSELPKDTKINISGLLKVYFNFSAGPQDVDIILKENGENLYGEGTIYEIKNLDGQASSFTVKVEVTKKLMTLTFGKGNLDNSKLSNPVNYLNITVDFYKSNIILLDGDVHIKQLGGD